MSPIFAYAAELYREMREEFELHIEAAHASAEAGTRGAMLNKHGRAEGIDAYSLMTGPWSRVERYGSAELIEWCELHGRPSVARFEREWFASWQGETSREGEEFPADGVMRTADLTGPEHPGILVSFPQDTNLTPEMRAELIQRFRDAQGAYPVAMNFDHPTRHAADC